MLERALNDTVTYWEKTGATDRYGKPVLSSPVQIKCRWEDRQSQIVNKQGTEVISKSRVFTLTPISIDGYLARGTIASSDPRPLDDAFEIQQVSSTPDLRSLKSLVTVYL
jgi:hypothetical protein